MGNKYLVEGAIKDEWVFMIIPTITLLLYAFTKNIGKYIHLAWISMWFITQFFSHEWYTMFGSGFMGDVDGKISYFKDCIQVVNIQGRYVPDLYHLILHLMLIVSIVSVIMELRKEK